MKIANAVAVLGILAGCAREPSVSRGPHDAVHRVAGTYTQYHRMNDLLQFSKTTRCMAPPPPEPRMSASRDESTHGRKLYYMFALDSRSYSSAKYRDQPVGQTIVKESWLPAKEGRSRGPLFIMMKTGEPDSDDGWIYATATPDGKTITAAGKLESCMECHRSKTRDRMFGMSPERETEGQ